MTPAHVLFGSKADIAQCQTDVRFTPEADIRTWRLVSNDNSVRPVSADAWGWRSPNPPGISRRLLVSDCHIPECVCRMARPIVFWAQTDTALLVLTLVVIAKRIASSFSRRVIKPASRKHAPRRFYAHHRGTGFGILDRNAAVEAGFGPVIDVTLAGDIVRRHAIVR